MFSSWFSHCFSWMCVKIWVLIVEIETTWSIYQRRDGIVWYLSIWGGNRALTFVSFRKGHRDMVQETLQFIWMCMTWRLWMGVFTGQGLAYIILGFKVCWVVLELCIVSMNDCCCCCCCSWLCVWFLCALTVHGVEYAFGAHEYPTSGVFEVEPRCCPGFKFRKSILMGTTCLDPVQFREFMERNSANYNGDMYHLIVKNCNHFCEDICYKLTGKHIPKWVNRLARIGNST